MCVCVCTVFQHLFVYNVSHQGRMKGVTPALPGACFWSHSFTWHPEVRWPHDLPPQPLPRARTEAKTLCRPGAERERERAKQDCKPVNIMLYLDAYSALTALTHSFEQETSHKDFLEAHLLFVDCPLLSKRLQTCNCDATSNPCCSLNARGRHCAVADEKPLH